LFFAGVLSHIWGCYNNDRLDLSIDKKAKYCAHKPLVSGSVSLKTATIIEFAALIIFVSLIAFISPKISTIFYLFGAIFLAYLYNRYNKSNMFINIVGQMYATFFALVGMSIVVDFDQIVFLSAIVMGINGVYLNIIEADIKDIKGDIVNVPKSLGVKFKKDKAIGIAKFYLLNEIMKFSAYIIIFYILLLEEVEINIILLTCLFFALNFLVRIAMFKNLSPNREKMKPYIAAQELSSILFISMIYIIVYPFIPLLVVLFVIIWLSIWNKILWGTLFRPQV
jgi:4-hydroxybenzoate polyprenyltransferase